MKTALQLGGLALAGLLGWAGYYEFAAPCAGMTENRQDPDAGWAIFAFSGRSRLLGRETLQVILVTRRRDPSVSDGRSVKVAGHTLRGRGRVFLLDPRAQLTETQAPIFDGLWGTRLSETRNPLRGYLKTLPQDEALRKFLE